MLVDALALLLGERASGDMIRPGAARAIVEAAFDLEPESGVAERAAELGIDLEDHRLAVRREIHAAGRNRAWANGSPTTVAALATLGRHVVDLHGQHEAQSLLKGPSQRDILDAFGGAQRERTAVRDAFALASTLRQREAELAAKRADVRRRADYLRHVAKEITDAQVRDGEDEELDVESKRLSNVEALTDLSGRLLRLLDDDEGGALDVLSQVSRALDQLERIDDSVARWSELLESARANVEELGLTIREYGSEIESDPGRLAEVERRRDQVYRLRQKYGPGIADVQRTGEQAQRELDLLDTADLDLVSLAEQRSQAEADLAAAVKRLGAKRKRAAERLTQAVDKILPPLGLPGGRLRIAIEPADQVTTSGGDDITFLVKLNEGIEPRPLAQVASGGELSRIMLALKVVLARHHAVSTLVFDEVDQGIGGEVAVQVATALGEVAASRQVLVITHLAPIAARAEHHLRVDKKVRGGISTAEVRALENDARVIELARMLGDAGDSVAREHAAGMLSRSRTTSLSSA
jgi:DNA repair protein RecN (Recombination protein N)